MPTENISFPLSLMFISFILTLVLTGIARTQLIKRAVMDIPNSRSMHSAPVPRGGGIAVVFVVLIALLIASASIEQSLHHLGVIAAATILAGVSWLDDRHSLSPGIRLALHLTAALIGCTAFPATALLFNGLLPFWLDRAVMIVGWAWFINVYNFMDGIDGITAAQTIAMMTGLCFITLAAGMNDDFLAFLAIILTGSSLGFLAHNWHPAKIFLGDIGSIPMGYLCGFALLSLAVEGGQRIPALILPLYYLTDSGITIARRALRGEKIWLPHREHFYQKAATGAKRHDKVVRDIICTNIALIFAAMLAVSHPVIGLSSAIVMVAILLKKMHITAVRKPSVENHEHHLR